MTAAEELREAARLMRERANDAPRYGGAVSEPWEASPHGDVHGSGNDWICDSVSGEAAEHIASWHPDVAFAVADLLETVPDTGTASITYKAALVVARAYLGSES